MDEIEITEMAAKAASFVNSTNKHIFLTGKAGTGKTTFLRQLATSTHKRHVILAPTGIAALNANGVTIHSQFLLPFGTYLPDRNLPDELPAGANFYTQRSLVRRHPLNAKRRDVLRNVDLLIIDEVSMLRADILDAIDSRMRSVKRNYREPFGGVQLLMIGDMYQLPPVVKDHEWSKMRQYYNSQHFFGSLGLKEAGFVYIELDKIFRQKDDRFISILNNLRNNVVTAQDIEDLNTHFDPDPDTLEEVITITTHNYQADQLNRKALDKLDTKSFYFEAEVDRDFPEKVFPVAESLELKMGAQIMFVKNDTESGAYFNGKLAKVTAIDDDGIEVLMSGSDIHYQLRREIWENKKYTVDETTKDLEEEVVGTFTQYPIKLAWAITVHKSQGLTFEKAVIDVGQAFAPGQVYVALSRLTSLEGLVLRTRIDPSVVSTDSQVIEFSQKKEQQDPLVSMLENGQAEYLKSLLMETFDLTEVIRQINRVNEKHNAKDQFEDEEMRNALNDLATGINDELNNTEKFKQQLRVHLHNRDKDILLERIGKGSAYYIAFLKKNMRDLLKHLEEVKQFSRTKTYQTALTEIDLLLMKKWEQMDKAQNVAQCILEGKDISPQPEQSAERAKQRSELFAEVAKVVEENPKNTQRKSGRVRKKKDPNAPKKVKGATYLETFTLVQEGLDAEQIAEKRGLKASTIETHIARGIQNGKFGIEKVMDKNDLENIETCFKENEGISMGQIIGKLNGEYSYGQLRMVQAHLSRKEEQVAE